MELVAGKRARLTSRATRAGSWVQRIAAPWVPLVIVLVLAAALIAWAGRGIGFIGDEWGWIYGATHASARWVLMDYNGHLQATTFLTFWALLHAFGMAHIGAFRAVTLVLHLAVVAGVFSLIRPRLGTWTATCGALLVAVLGTGADAFLTALELPIVFATAASVGALVALDRDTRGGDVIACLLLVVALSSFSSAVAFAAGILVELLIRRVRWRRLWVPLLPTALYVAWRLHYASSSNGVHAAGSPFAAIGHAYQAAVGAFAGLIGLQLTSPTLRGRAPWLAGVIEVLLGIAILAVAWSTARRRAGRPRLANLLVAGCVLWLLIALFRGGYHDLYPSRYVYVGAVIVVLMTVELVPRELIAGSRGRALLIAGVAVCAGLNIAWMVVWANHLRSESTTAEAQLAALELSRGTAAASYQPSTSFGTGELTAGEYFASLGKFGPPGSSAISRLRAAPESGREAADQVLVGAGQVALRRGGLSAGGPPRLERALGAEVSIGGSCVVLGPVGRLATAELTPASRGIVLQVAARGGALLEARRFGSRYVAGLGAVTSAEGPATVLTGSGGVGGPWHIRVVANRRIRLCGG
jgi:hypothetical protein